MDPFLADGAHTVRMRGVVDVEDVATRADVLGTLSLFPDGGTVAMSYSLRFDDDRGRPWRLSGTKAVRSRTPWGLLAGLTTLRCEASPLDPEPGAGLRFVLTIGTGDLARLGTSISGRGFTRPRRIRAVARFLSFFAISAVRRRPTSADRVAPNR